MGLPEEQKRHEEHTEEIVELTSIGKGAANSASIKASTKKQLRVKL